MGPFMKPRPMKPRLERLEARQLLASDWQNPLNPFDVDNSGTVQPSDVLLTLNDYKHRAGPVGVRSPNTTEPFCDVNGDNVISTSDVLHALVGLNSYIRNPLTLELDLTAESDRNGNEVVLQPVVTYRGTTLPYTKVRVTAADDDTDLAEQLVRSDAAGSFQFQLDLTSPLNHIKITANDPRLRSKSVEREIRLGNVIADWNAMLLEVIRESTAPASTVPGLLIKPPPPLAAKQLAMVHVAMLDAMNAINPTYEAYAFHGAVQSGASEIAAAAAAAHRVATSLFSVPAQLAQWEATLTESLGSVPDGPAKSLGIEIGHAAGDSMLARRLNDGSGNTVEYTPGTQPGDWQPTPPDLSHATLPQWPNVTPFVMDAGDQFRPAPPPAIDSPEYAAAVDQVMRLGSKDSDHIRTADQTEIAKFWADGAGTATPPGHWNQIATDIGLQLHQPLLEQAHTLALLNLALADAAISSWDAKYAYELWRPIDAIRKASTDGNAATVENKDWTPLLNTPSFPAYTSGHSTFSAAAAAVLTSVYGDGFAFSTLTDRGAAGIWPPPKDISGLKERSFTSFEAAAEEAGFSRIYGGIHFNFDNEAGLASGRAIGELVVSIALQPL
jgi:PAP2 superfamily